MSSNVFEELKNTHLIVDSEEYIVLFDKTLYIMKKSDLTVKNLTEYRDVFKGLILSGNRLLIDCGKQRSYIMLDLATGLELWRVPIPKSDYTYSKFVVTPDHHFVYDYANKKGKYILIRIDTGNQTVKHSLIENEYRCVYDLICDHDGLVWSLQGHLEFDETQNAETSESFSSVGGVHLETLQAIAAPIEKEWRHRWEANATQPFHLFLGNADLVMNEDLTVFCAENHTTYSLVGNDAGWGGSSSHLCSCRCFTNSSYIMLVYDRENIIIDLHTRKMIARYAVELFHKGCLIDGEFWIGTTEGILRKPFPAIEDIPFRKHPFIM